VIRKKKLAFPVLIPRYKADGTRNVIDLSSPTLGADIQALVQASTAVLERLYPFPRVEEVTFDRTDTAYQTMASGRKFKLDGEGGIRTVSFMLPGDDGVEAIARELSNGSCSEVDVFEVTVDGNIWGVMDDTSVAALRGYAMERETFDSFIQRAVDGSINGVMVSWDLESDEDFVNSYAITSSELGYKATSLRPLIRAACTAQEASSVTIEATVVTDFGTATNKEGVLGLLTANFTVTANGTPVTVTAAEVGEGVYTLTHADLDITPGDDVIVSVSATSYDVANGTFVATL